MKLEDMTKAEMLLVWVMESAERVEIDRPSGEFRLTEKGKMFVEKLYLGNVRPSLGKETQE